MLCDWICLVRYVQFDPMSMDTKFNVTGTTPCTALCWACSSVPVNVIIRGVLSMCGIGGMSVCNACAISGAAVSEHSPICVDHTYSTLTAHAHPM